jgi:methoxymalonate biosynthesis acyl carrier protein
VFNRSCAVFRGEDMASRLTNGIVRARDGGRGAMTTTGSLQAELSDLFANMLHVQVPSPDTDLLATARLDSVGMVELLLQIEKRFGVRVDMRDFEIDHFRSLSAIAAFVAERRRDQTA